MVDKIKRVFGQIGALLETKQELIKPIFISLCQENDELCKWVVNEQLLNFEALTLGKIQFLGEIICAMRTEDQFKDKLEMAREFLFNKIQAVALGLEEVNDESIQVILNKFIGIYSRSTAKFLVRFPKSASQPGGSSSKVEIQDLLEYKERQQAVFDKDEALGKKIYRSVMKLLASMIQGPKNTGSKLTSLEVAQLSIARQVAAHQEEDQYFVVKMQDLDVLTALAANDAEVYRFLQKSTPIAEIFGYSELDIIQSIVNQLIAPAKREEDQDPDPPEAVRAAQTSRMSRFSQYLYNLSQSPLFFA